ncbi:TfuA-like protein [Kribbella sp. NPDC048928]|uniref:TfuA-like protein n=1 Tax=Kribbella sp. NPDC048928 TaxID=3364111 RepID=UPI003722547A
MSARTDDPARPPKIHLYTGPSFDPADEPELCAGLELHGPIKHGDLFDPDVRPGDSVLIVDGVFHQARALRHKEILHALSAGIAVFGSSSIGALRAMELRSFGMVGLGRVFELYAAGVVEGDDEVAVAQRPDGAWAALSIPMVNARAMVDSALAAGVVGPAAAGVLVERIREIYYPQRNLLTIRAAVGPEHQAFVDWLAARLGAEPTFCNIKRADVVAAIPAVRRAAATLHHRSDPRLDRHTWRTGFYRDWVNYFATDATARDLPVRIRVQYQQIFLPGFPDIWTEYLDRLSGSPVDGAEPAPLGRRIRSVLGGAGGSQVPASELFRPRLHLGSAELVTLLLGHEQQADLSACRTALATNAEFARRWPGRSHLLMRRPVAERVLCELWAVEARSLSRVAATRGFRTSEDAVETFLTFVLGYLQQIRSADRPEAAAKVAG